MSTVLVSNNLLQNSSPTSSAGSSDIEGFEKHGNVNVSVNEEVPPLGVPKEEKRFFFQRTKEYDPNAIATQVRHL